MFAAQRLNPTFNGLPSLFQITVEEARAGPGTAHRVWRTECLGTQASLPNTHTEDLLLPAPGHEASSKSSEALTMDLTTELPF